MQKVAEQDKFRHIFFGVPSIGGRYSALSDFGMAPAAIMGLDVPRFLNVTRRDGTGLRSAVYRWKKILVWCWARYSACWETPGATKSP